MKKVVFAFAVFLLLFSSMAFALVITKDTMESTTDRTAVFNVTTDQSTIITIFYANETWYNAHSSDPLNIRINNQYNDNIYKITRTPTISGLSPGTKYYYYVYASTSGGQGAQGQIKSFTTAANQPPTATQVSATDITTDSVKLLCTASSDVDFASYKIYRSESAGVDESSTLVITITEKNNASYTDAQLTNNTTYYYKVYVVDSGDLSTGSNEVSGKTTEIHATINAVRDSKNIAEAQKAYNDAIENYNTGNFEIAKSKAEEAKNTALNAPDLKKESSDNSFLILTVGAVILLVIIGAAVYFLIIKKKSPAQIARDLARSPAPEQS